jgi:hypothetical protein
MGKSEEVTGSEWLVAGLRARLLLRAQLRGDLLEINKCAKPAEHFNQQGKQRVLAPGCCAGKHENPIYLRLAPCAWDRFR